MNLIAHKKDFPHFQRKIRGKRIIYLDSAATSLKPRAVIIKEREYYEKYTANIFRGIYSTSQEATDEYEHARLLIAGFIHARPQEIVFTRNTTESVNLVMYALSRTDLSTAEITTTIMEHHSNFVPWQQLAKRYSLPFHVVGIHADGTLNFQDIERYVSKHTRIFAVTAVSNVLGTINPITDIVRTVKRINPSCLVLVDAAQAVPHMPIDVQMWGADFVAFSGHKMCGPTGVGVLWGKIERLEKLAPFMYGGEMISKVGIDQTEFKPVPHVFEAGTPHIAGVIGFGAAVEYLQAIGMENVRAHELALTRYALQRISGISNVSCIGPLDPALRGGVIAFTISGVHPHDIAQVLDEKNIFIRAGHHCAQPLHAHLGLSGSARASLYIYTTKQDIDAWIEGLVKVQKFFA